MTLNANVEATTPIVPLFFLTIPYSLTLASQVMYIRRECLGVGQN